MRKIAVICMAFFLCLSSAVAAQDNGDYLNESTFKDTLNKVAVFGAGWMTGLLTHELGHYVVGEIEGVDVEHDGIYRCSPQLKFKTSDNSKLRNVALAGFGTQIISTEIMLYDGKVNNNFELGWLCHNIFYGVFYALRKELSSNGCGYGDLETIEDSGWSSRWVEAVMVTHALVSVYRIYKHRNGLENDPDLKPKIRSYIMADQEKFFLGVRIKF
jgi:hypothetical protein